MDQRRLWTKEFILAFIVNILMCFPFYLLMTSMALYAADRFHAGEAMSGFASSAFIAGAVLARAGAGPLLDRVGRRRTMLVGLAVIALMAALYLPAGDLWAVLVIRAVHGIAFGVANTALYSAVQFLFPASRRGEGSGYFGASTSLAAALGPFLAVWLVTDFGYSWLFAANLVISVLGLLSGIFLRVPEDGTAFGSQDKTAATSMVRLSTFLNLATMPVALTMMLAGLAYSVVLTFLAGYTAAMGHPETAGAFFLVFAAAMLLSRLFLGRLQDARGDNSVIYPLLALFAVGLGLVAWAPNTWVILAAAMPMGVGFGSLLPSIQTVVVKQVPATRVSVAIATFFILLDGGTAVGPVLLGSVQPLIGASGVYWLAMLVVLAAMLVYTVAHGRLPRAKVRRNLT